MIDRTLMLVPAPGSGASDALLFGHGLGDAADLPLPFGIVLWLVGAALLGTAAFNSSRRVAERARTSVRSGAGSPGAPPEPGGGWSLPRFVDRLADHPLTALALRATLLLLLVLTLLLAAFGPDRAAVSPVPRVVYVLFWALLVPLSLLLGPFWRFANPLRLVAGGLARLAGDPEEATVRPLSPAAGVWPAAILLAVFTWGELALPEQPRLTAIVVLLVVLAVLAGTARYGSAWIGSADPFETYSWTLGMLAPLGRLETGAVVLRSPRRRLATLTPPAGLGAVVAVLIGADLFDGVLATLTWQNLKVGLPLASRVLVDSAGLTALVLFVGLLVWAATGRARDLSPALLPVVAAYAVAHYVPVLLIELQVALAQVSDPLGRGWDLFGTAGAAATYDALPGPLLAVGLLLVLLVGHVAAIVVAADRAQVAYGPRGAAAAQLPLQALVVLSALASVAMRFSGA